MGVFFLPVMDAHFKRCSKQNNVILVQGETKEIKETEWEV